MIKNNIHYLDNSYQLEAIQSLTNSIEKKFSLDYIEDYNTVVKLKNESTFHKIKIAGVFLFAFGASSIINSSKELKSYNFDNYNAQSLSLYLTNNAFAEYNNKKFSKIFGYNGTTVKLGLILRILSFKSLVNSWNGYGAVPLEIESAANAIEIINRLNDNIFDFLSDIYPNPHGTVSFDFENDSNERISIEIGNKNFSYYVKYNSQEPVFYDNITLDEKSIKLLSNQIERL